jgi:hypothetical protein
MTEDTVNNMTFTVTFYKKYHFAALKYTFSDMFQEEKWVERNSKDK